MFLGISRAVLSQLLFNKERRMSLLLSTGLYGVRRTVVVAGEELGCLHYKGVGEANMPKKGRVLLFKTMKV